MSAAEVEVDEISKKLFELLDSFPRMHDRCVAPLAEGRRGALVLRGAVRMLSTVVAVSDASKAQESKDRFKVLLSRAKWTPQESLLEDLGGCGGTKGLKARAVEVGWRRACDDATGSGMSGERQSICLVSIPPRKKAPAMVCAMHGFGRWRAQERIESMDVDREYVVVVVGELGPDELYCVHDCLRGVPSVPDIGPWLYVLDHGAERSRSRPGFSYAALKPFRVAPDLPVPPHINKPDYYETGDPRAERTSVAKDVPPVLTFEQATRRRGHARRAHAHAHAHARAHAHAHARAHAHAHAHARAQAPMCTHARTRREGDSRRDQEWRARLARRLVARALARLARVQEAK
eukprot:2226933-Pleurochrysis_carterae.AAC.1